MFGIALYSTPNSRSPASKSIVALPIHAHPPHTHTHTTTSLWQYLDLSKNILKRLPADVRKLKALKRLDISENNLSEIDAAVATLLRNSLHTLLLDRNPQLNNNKQSGLNLLHQACGANQLEVVKVLLKTKDIDVNLVTSPVKRYVLAVISLPSLHKSHKLAH